jgi:hypothetical protein
MEHAEAALGIVVTKGCHISMLILFAVVVYAMLKGKYDGGTK